MAGMNPGFAAYLAAKKASKKTVAPSVTSGVVPPVQSAGPVQPIVNAVSSIPQPIFKSPVASAPKGKRHSKIKVAPKKGK